MVYIYILKLLAGKYYVGKTNDPQTRIMEHFNGRGSAWTSKYRPTHVYDIVSNCDHYDEDKYTVKMMATYGIQNVRGGSFVKINLDQNDINTITKMINSGQNKCFQCGNRGHFFNNCHKCEVCDSFGHDTIECLRVIDRLEREYYDAKRRKLKN